MLPGVRQSPTPPRGYWDPVRYDEEMDLIFCRHWLFAGFAAQLQEHEDFITANLTERLNVVVQNCHGQLKAFRNICSHRNAVLMPMPCGRQPLRCCYHGWTYAADGSVVGIPGQAQNFGFTPSERQPLGLQQFDVDRVGPLIFVRLSRQGPSLKEWLGSFAPIAESWSHLCDLPFETNSLAWKCNWKLGVENTLESYHVGFCHDQSLGSMVNPIPVNRTEAHYSTTLHQLVDQSVSWWERVLGKGGWNRHGEPDYRHFFVYPNLCIGLTYGSLLSVQTFEPTSPETVNLNYRLLLPRAVSADSEAESFRLTIQNYLSTFNASVLEEDQRPVELCQAGNRRASNTAWLGDGERRLLHFLELVESDLATSV